MRFAFEVPRLVGREMESMRKWRIAKDARIGVHSVIIVTQLVIKSVSTLEHQDIYMGNKYQLWR